MNAVWVGIWIKATVAAAVVVTDRVRVTTECGTVGVRYIKTSGWGLGLALGLGFRGRCRGWIRVTIRVRVMGQA